MREDGQDPGFWGEEDGLFPSPWNQFYAPDGIDSLAFYDSAEDCFWVIGFVQSTPVIFIAVSTDVSSASGWKKYALDASLVDGIDSSMLAIDRPNSSIQDDVVCVSFWGGWLSAPTVRNGVVIIDKEELLEGETGQEIENVKGDMMPTPYRKVHAYHGVKTDTSDTSPIYLVEIDREHPHLTGDPEPCDDPYENLELFAITGGWQSPSVTGPFTLEETGAWYPVKDGNCSSGGYHPAIPQGDGSSNQLALNDSRILDAVYRDGYLWAVHHARQSSTGEVKVRWYKVSMNDWENGGSDPTLSAAGWVSPGSGLHAHYPSIAVNQYQHALICFTYSGSSTYPTIQHWYSDPSGHFDAVDVKESEDYKTGATPARWGDYSGAVVDPDDECTFYTVHEYVKDDGNDLNPGSAVWGIWIAKHVEGNGNCPPGSFGGGDNPGSSPNVLRRLDFIKDGFVDVFDILEFQNYFDRKHRRADWNRDGTHDVFDFIAYMNDFRAAQ